MRNFWRVAANSCRFRPIHALAIALAIFFTSTSAFAQSSVGRAANEATGQSLRDAVEQNEKELVDREVLGSSAEGGAALGAGASPTGRVRGSDHDAMEVPAPDTENFAWDTSEASAFATGIYAMPGTTLGGQLKLSIFAGYNWLSLTMKNGGGNTLSTDKGQSGKAENDSGLVGGTALWSQKNTYAMATIVGMWGETTLKDAIDFCEFPPGTIGCPLRIYDFDTRGFIGTLTAGHVFALSSSPTGPKLDIRGAASYTRNEGDTFANFKGDTQKWTFSAWTLTGSATLFANIPVQNSALLRPYLQAYVRQEIDYRNELYFDLFDPTDIPNTGIVRFDQAHTYGGVDLGLTYALGNMTLGSAIYFDGSADEQTLGGRVGASWKLN
jgi:hypothetical protein